MLSIRTYNKFTLIAHRQSYSRRLLGVKVKAKTFSTKLAAPGRRQSLYFFFQICRDLCFY